MFINRVRQTLFLVLLMVGLVGLAWPSSGLAIDAVSGSGYNSDIAQKIVGRCDLIKDYLTQTARINELAARQNKVRGWEYILRQLESTGQSYAKLNVSSDELKSGVTNLKKQLDQFKTDFEVYDGAFQKLNNIDCVNQPEAFWNQLQNVRGLRSGVALASDNFNLNLSNLLAQEEAKW